jgi:hypothetical protein
MGELTHILLPLSKAIPKRLANCRLWFMTTAPHRCRR